MTDLDQEIRRRARGQKANRRWVAYVRGLDGYHPRFVGPAARPAWTERAWLAIVDPEDRDGPVGEPAR